MFPVVLLDIIHDYRLQFEAHERRVEEEYNAQVARKNTCLKCISDISRQEWSHSNYERVSLRIPDFHPDYGEEPIWMMVDPCLSFSGELWHPDGRYQTGGISRGGWTQPTE